MNEQAAVERPGDDQRAASARIGAAGRLLREGKSKVPDGFAKLLFGHAAPEDVVGYEARELAALAREAWTFVASRKPGTSKIRFDQPDATAGDHLKTISVIELINDDMPFLVNSVMGELTERGLAPRLVLHPILAVERDKSGKLKAALTEAGKANGEPRESFIHVHVARVDDETRRADTVKALENVLEQVRAAVADWKPMLRRVGEVIQELKANPPPVPVDDIAEAIQFLEWLAAENFTLFGVSDYAFSGKTHDLRPVKDSGLGILRNDEIPVFTRDGHAVSVTPQIRAFFDEPKTLIVMKANVKSRIHRRAYLDYVGVKRFDTDGNPVGEFRVVGLVHVDGLHALDPQHSVSAPQGRCGAAARRLRSRQPFRQGARQRAGELPARRAVPDRRGHAVRVRAGDPAARRASARARAGAPGPI